MPKDELKLYRGEDFIISDHIHIHQPTLNEICDYGEADYYAMIYQLTATPQSMKAQLWDAGIDYTKITPFELFYSILYKLFPMENFHSIWQLGPFKVSGYAEARRWNGSIVSGNRQLPRHY